MATEIGNLTHHNTAGHIASGEHTATAMSLCIDFITMLSWRDGLISVSYQGPRV